MVTEIHIFQNSGAPRRSSVSKFASFLKKKKGGGLEGGGIPGLSKPMEFITFFAFRDLGLWEHIYGHVWSSMIHLGPYPPTMLEGF